MALNWEATVAHQASIQPLDSHEGSHYKCCTDSDAVDCPAALLDSTVSETQSNRSSASVACLSPLADTEN